jgi:hypothetical protein
MVCRRFGGSAIQPGYPFRQSCLSFCTLASRSNPPCFHPTNVSPHSSTAPHNGQWRPPPHSTATASTAWSKRAYLRGGKECKKKGFPICRADGGIGATSPPVSEGECLSSEGDPPERRNQDSQLGAIRGSDAPIGCPPENRSQIRENLKQSPRSLGLMKKGTGSETGCTCPYVRPLLSRTRLPLSRARRASEGGQSLPRLRFGLV